MKKKIVGMSYILALPLALFLFFSLICEGFGIHTLQIVISQSIIPTILGLAMALVMQCGMIDFSAGARVVLGASMGCVMGKYLGIPGFLMGCILGAFLAGLFVAVLYQVLKIPSMVVTMGAVLVLEVVSYKISELGGATGAVKIGNEIARVANWPKNFILVVIAGALYYLIQYRTSFGCQVMACGNDEVMLKNMGVRTDRLKFHAFVLSGIFCAFGAMIQSCYSGQVTIAIGMASMSMTFKPLMGVMIGMQFTKLVDNLPLMILVGELSISVIFNGFIAMGLTDNLQNIVLGIFLLLVLGVSGNTERMVEYRRKQEVRRQAKAG